MDQDLIVALLSLQELDDKIAQAGTASKTQNTKRIQLLAKIPSSTRGRYEQLRLTHDSAVVACSGGYCTGCQMRVPPYVANRVEHAGELERCERCGRFLHGPVSVPGKKKLAKVTDIRTPCLLK